MYSKYIKVLFDFIVACIGIIVLLPVFITVFICLLMANNGKAFFFQNRPGKNGKIFKIIKFKTMNDKRDVNGILLSDANRLTKVGIFIRKTSLDEIPQLLNVLNGDMSLIGPRPLLPEYLPLYNDFQKQRHNVKPGITGWAQVNGRNALSWSQKFEYDVWYVKNVSFLLDLNILIKTIKKVIKRDGINSVNTATTELFNGES
ncbi:sugar transferase [Flavobacterium hydatis]|uniref:Lipid carrier--UDP-N-acetylgalactosaminyltransferase n=1 Tax=Flavobacterium hydatis TaxID=991 RepID=A0A086ANK8_FLAHY|nr:sugar transferase [Flavobacterium hydatis]KFF18272.1 UDP-galactose phosphate transferase [Flavobacterium hydatis]OXA96978.1 lipid carrier--UDP-N-acetylgalactosaminyltransferase [Flavobacterium hydatis]